MAPLLNSSIDLSMIYIFKRLNLFQSTWFKRVAVTAGVVVGIDSFRQE